MKRIIFIKEILATAIICLFIFLSSCYYPKSSPGWEYMPDMANSIASETNMENDVFPDSMGQRPPVPGTIPRGVYEPFHYSMNLTGYDSAGLYLHFPAWLDSNSLTEGQRLFTIYCAVCHGADGKGDGTIVTAAELKNPFPPPPSYFSDALINLPEGKMYYSAHYGKNLMGPYSKLLDHNQLWEVVYYIKSLQKKSMTGAAPADSTKATASADTTKKK